MAAATNGNARCVYCSTSTGPGRPRRVDEGIPSWHIVFESRCCRRRQLVDRRASAGALADASEVWIVIRPAGRRTFSRAIGTDRHQLQRAKTTNNASKCFVTPGGTMRAQDMTSVALLSRAVLVSVGFRTRPPPPSGEDVRTTAPKYEEITWPATDIDSVGAAECRNTTARYSVGW